MDDSINTDLANSIKIVILGASGVGKSSILTRYVRKEFITMLSSTIGVDFMKADVELEGGVKKKFTIWDTAGSERFRGVASSYFKGAMGIIVVFNYTEKESLDQCDLINDEIKNYGESDAVLVLAGNKSDLKDKIEVTDEEAETKSKKMGAKAFFKVSAKEDNGEIDDMFKQLAKFIDVQENERGSKNTQKDKKNRGSGEKLSQKGSQVDAEGDDKDGCKC